MYSSITSRNQACPPSFGLMLRASEGVIESYSSDLFHDAMFLDEKNREKNLIDRQVEDGESVFWSVGDCGSHISICTHKRQRPWMSVDSYAKYNHYQVWFSIAESGLITAQLIRLED